MQPWAARAPPSHSLLTFVRETRGARSRHGQEAGTDRSRARPTGSRGHLFEPGVHRALAVGGDPRLRARVARAAEGEGLRARDSLAAAREVAAHGARSEPEELREPVRRDQAPGRRTEEPARLHLLIA